MIIAVAFALSLIAVYFAVGIGTAPCKSEKKLKEKWEEEYSLIHNE